MSFDRESDLCRVVIDRLEESDWDVYQEVEIARHGSRADIVAIRNGIILVVEAKRSLSFELLEQCAGWIGYAHYIIAAVPRPKRSHWIGGHRMAQRVVESLGFGLWRCDDEGADEDVRPRLWRNAPHAKRLRLALAPEHKTHAQAGTNRGGHWTPYRNTCEQVWMFVREHPGASTKDVIASLRHHYASDATAKGCLLKWGREGKIPGVELRDVDRRIEWHPRADHVARAQ